MVGYKIKRLNNNFVVFKDNEYAHNSTVNQKGYRTLSDSHYEESNIKEKFNDLSVSKFLVVKSKIIM